MHPPPLSDHEERPEPHDILPGRQDVHSAALLLLPADNCPLETLQPARLSSLPSLKAGRQQQTRWWAPWSSWPHPESSWPWKYAASRLSLPAGLDGLTGAPTAADVSPAAARRPTWTAKPLWSSAATGFNGPASDAGTTERSPAERAYNSAARERTRQQHSRCCRLGSCLQGSRSSSSWSKCRQSGKCDQSKSRRRTSTATSGSSWGDKHPTWWTGNAWPDDPATVQPGRQRSDGDGQPPATAWWPKLLWQHAAS